MDPLTDFASLFKERENTVYSGPQIGNVVSISPLSVSLGDRISLKGNRLIQGGSVGELLVGDEVILIPSADNQRYFLIDKVVK